MVLFHERMFSWFRKLIGYKYSGVTANTSQYFIWQRIWTFTRPPKAKKKQKIKASTEIFYSSSMSQRLDLNCL